MLEVKIPEKLSVPAVEKVIDYTASGIGSIAGPLLKPYKAWGDAKALDIQAIAQKKALDTLGYQGTDISVELNIEDTISQKIQFQETKRLLNTRSVVVEAANRLGDKEVPNTEPDHDWTARFFNHVQDVSTEEMQSLWAKVLAGEVEQPGSTSLLTLDTLRNLDQSTASMFRRFCSASVYLTVGGTIIDARVPSLGGNVSQNSLEQYGLGYLTLIRLNEHGLVVPDFDSWRGLPAVLLQKVGILFQGNKWHMSLRESEEMLKLHGVAMTNSGMELSKIVEIEPMPDFTEAFRTFLSKHVVRGIEIIKVPVD